MHVVAVIASASVPVKVLLVCLVAITGVSVYRRAFPRTADDDDVSADPQPSIDGVGEIPSKNQAAQAEEDPKSLVSVFADFRLRGFLYVFNGVALGVVAVAVEPRRNALALFVTFAVAVGAMAYPFSRHTMRSMAERASSLRMPERATAVGIWRGVILWLVLPLMVVDLLAVTSPITAILSGSMLGLGAAALGISRWLSDWENEHSVCLLRESWSWLGPGKARHFFAVGRQT